MTGNIHIQAVMLLNMYKNLHVEVKLMLRLNFKKKIKIKSLVAWSISEGRVDQKRIINFVQPNTEYGIHSYLSRMPPIELKIENLLK